MLVSLQIKAQVQCSACQRWAPLSALQLAMPCEGCGQVIDVRRATAQGRMQGPAHFFGGYLDLYREATALMKEGGEARDDANQVFQMSWRRLRPFCGRCSAPVDEDALSAAQQGVVCACGHQVPARPADVETHHWDPRVRWCVAPQSVQLHEKAASEAQGGLVHCGLCAAPLPAGRPGCVVRCGFCGQANTLLDRRLDAAALGAAPFFVVYSVDIFDIALAQRFFLRGEHLGVDAHFLNTYRLTEPEQQALANNFAATLGALSHMQLDQDAALRRLPDLPWEIAEALLWREDLERPLLEGFLAREDLPKDQRKDVKKRLG